LTTKTGTQAVENGVEPPYSICDPFEGCRPWPPKPELRQSRTASSRRTPYAMHLPLSSRFT